MIRSGKLRAARVGRVYRVPVDYLDDYLELHDAYRG